MPLKGNCPDFMSNAYASWPGSSLPQRSKGMFERLLAGPFPLRYRKCFLSVRTCMRLNGTSKLLTYQPSPVPAHLSTKPLCWVHFESPQCTQKNAYDGCLRDYVNSLAPFTELSGIDYDQLARGKEPPGEFVLMKVEVGGGLGKCSSWTALEEGQVWWLEEGEHDIEAVSAEMKGWQLKGTSNQTISFPVLPRMWPW